MGEPTAIKQQFEIRKNIPIPPLHEPKLKPKSIVRDTSDDSLSKGAIRYRVQIAGYQRGEKIL